MLVRPHHVPLRETMLWLDPHIQTTPANILEIGCGQGHLAAALAGAGHQVVAVEADAAAASAARYKGVNVLHGRFPHVDLPDQSFDCVLFSRSLHQMPDLDAACGAAFAALAPGGSVLVEDWAWNILDERGAAWAYGLMGIGHAIGFVPKDRWRGGNEPLMAWLAQHEGFAHALATMREAITKHGVAQPTEVTLLEESAPYFYRYFCDYLADAEDGSTIVESVLAAEKQMLSARAMAPLGWRMTAVRADR